MTYQLGIDLGTTYSAAAILRDRDVTMVSLGVRSIEVPSVVFLREDGEFLIGEAAERRGQTEPGRLAREFKRRLGDPVPMLLAGSPYSPQALTARLLRWIVDAVTAREGGPPDRIVVTCPANWGEFKQDQLLQAIQLADVENARLETEPLAAAVHYASTTRVSPGDIVAVYDLGGGTFDSAVLRKTSEWFEVLGRPEGIEHLGGIDFDEAVFGYVVRALGDRLTFDRSDPAAVAGMARLRRECVGAKEALSEDSDVSIPVLLPGLQTEIRLTRSEFEGMIRPSLADTIAAMRRTLRSTGVESEALKAVVLVGGSGRVPLVGELVRAELGVAIAIDTHPKHSVAMGAARLAAVEPTAPAAAPQPPRSAAAAWAPPATAEPEPTTSPTQDTPAPELRATPPPPREPPAPPPSGEPESLPPGSPEEESAGSGRRRLVLAAGAAAILGVIAVAVLLLAGGGDDENESSDSSVSSTTVTTSDGSTPAVTGPGVECDPQTLALLVSLTGEDELDVAGIRNAAQLAVDQHNATNPGCPVTLRTLDTGASPEGAALGAEEAVGDTRVIGVVAADLSTGVLSAGPILESAGLAFVTSSAKSTELDEQGWRTFNRVLADDVAQGPAGASYLRDTVGARRVVVVNDSGGLGTAVADMVRAELGPLVVDNASIASGQTDFADTVATVIDAGADAVYFGGSFGDAGLMVKALREGGYTGTFAMPEGVNEPRLVASSGLENAEGALLTCSCAPRDVSQAFESAYRAVNDGDDPPAYAPEAYDATKILLAGIVDGVDTRTAMVTFVRSFHGEGITKEIEFDDRGQIVGLPTYVYRVERGEAVSIEFIP